MTVSVHNSCWGTNVSGHKHRHVCAQTIMSGHKCLWSQMPLGTNVSGHKHVWVQTCLGTVMYGLNRVDTIMSGHKRVWAQSCMGNKRGGTQTHALPSPARRLLSFHVLIVFHFLYF